MGSNNNGHRSLSAKAVGISTAAVVSAGVMLHYGTSGPSIFFRLASSEIPNLYRSLVSWLAPPYLYFVINGIIISIAASSKFHKSSSGSHSRPQLLSYHHHHNVFGSPSVPSAPTLVTERRQGGYAAASAAPPPVAAEGEVNAGCVVPAGARADGGVKNSDGEEEEYSGGEELVMSRSTCRAPDRTESVTAAGETDYGEKEQSQGLADYSFSTEKPLVSSRLIGRRKSLKATPEGGRTLRVSRPKRNDTLESTWRAITDGRAMPLTRHLKKSDTWETNHHTQQQQQQQQPEPVVMRKCETFTERDGDRGARRPPLSSGAAARLRKEPSIGQDDLNRRVEAFINKFNQEMKLQRQESFKHYFDMINRGSH